MIELATCRKGKDASEQCGMPTWDTQTSDCNAITAIHHCYFFGSETDMTNPGFFLHVDPQMCQSKKLDIQPLYSANTCLVVFLIAQNVSQVELRLRLVTAAMRSANGWMQSSQRFRVAPSQAYASQFKS